MQKLAAVEDARRLWAEAQEWSLVRWLWEKKRVRTTADAAVAAFDEYEKRVKAGWSDDLKKAYRELDAQAAADGNAKARRQYDKAREEAKDVDPELKLAAKRVKQADDAAYDARMAAEDTFDEAEKRLSTDLAREGARQALASYDLREKAIRRAEAAGRRK